MSEHDELWTVLNTVHHKDGSVTITAINDRGTILTEDYPPGAMITRVTKHGDTA